MQYRQLGRTDISVSVIGLGTMTWGEQNTEQDAFRQLDYAIERGINFIDTAEMYPVPPKESTQGLTELYIGNWLKRQARRDNLIIASKVSARAAWLPYLRGATRRLDEKNITKALDDSLKRLQTDYIDLYQLHWPERHSNFFGTLGYQHKDDDGVPILETLQVLAKLIDSGKIRNIGISNETPWGCSEYLHLAEKVGLPRIVSIQNPYNFLNRTFEIGLAEFAHREQCGLLAYSPLAFGVLSGKYLKNAAPKNARITLFQHFKRYHNKQAVMATECYTKLAYDHGLEPASMALAYVTSRPFVTSNLIGATTMAQLEMNINSLDIHLSKELLAQIEDIHERYPNPSP